MENFNVQEVVEKVMTSVQEEYKNLKTFNVMILGKTGVGKSTLINNVFHQKLTDTGVGKPITQVIRKITKPDFPLAIYDTPGFELGGENAFSTLLEEVTGEIEKKSGDMNEAIHCIWYCISTPSHRFEQAEVDFLREFCEKTSKYEVPIIIIMTQSYAKKETDDLKREIEKENLPVVKVIPILAEDYSIDEEYVVKAKGLKSLTETMVQILPAKIEKTFVSIQQVNMDLKKNKAHVVVATAAVAAAGTGAAPIPFSDAALLVPAQITMLAKITSVFGVPIEKTAITTIVTSTIGIGGATVLGKTVVANALKFIPGVGSVVGGVISGATAAALTAALGEAYIVIMERICKGELRMNELGTDKGKKEIAEVFTERLKVKRNKEGKAIE